MRAIGNLSQSDRVDFLALKCWFEVVETGQCWLVFSSPAGTNNTDARLCSGLLDQSMIQSINRRINGCLHRPIRLSLANQWVFSGPFQRLPFDSRVSHRCFNGRRPTMMPFCRA